MKKPKPNRLLTMLLVLLGLVVYAVSFVHAATTNSTSITSTLPLGLSSDQLVFVGVVLGVFFRLTFPYLAKARAAAQTAVSTPGTAPTPFKFDWHYGIIALGNIVQAGIVAVLLFPNLPPLSGFLGAFAWAYSSQDILSQFL